MLKDTVRKFVDRELIPIERTAREKHTSSSPRCARISPPRPRSWGSPATTCRQEYGGLGMGLVAKVTVWAELGRTIALPSRGVDMFGPNVSPILYHLNDEQKKKYLLPTIARRAELVPRPDRARRRRRSRRHAHHRGAPGRSLRHQRHEAIHHRAPTRRTSRQLIAATDRSKGSRGGISAFIVDMKAPGVKLLRAQELVVDDRPWEIAFENVKVPVENRIGEEGDGFSHAQHWLNVGRIRHGARGMGVIERCLELGTHYAKQRVTFGKPLAERQAVQWMLADSFMELHQLRLMVYDAAWKYDQGRDIRAEAYMAKIFGDTQSFHAADRCMEIHGGMGLATDLPIEKFWRDQRSMMITEGPIEILKMALARHVLRTYG